VSEVKDSACWERYKENTFFFFATKFPPKFFLLTISDFVHYSMLYNFWCWKVLLSKETIK
jgi:hypothetical protein